MGRKLTGKISGVFDTEQTTVDEETSFTWCYQMSIIEPNRALDDIELKQQPGRVYESILEYMEPNNGKGIRVFLNRTEREFAANLEYLFSLYHGAGYYPIICGFNLYHDFVCSCQVLIDVCRAHSWEMYPEPMMKSSVKIMRINVLDANGDIMFSLWDLQLMAASSLATYAASTEMPKLKGDLDYTKWIEQDTTLTTKEKCYCIVDTLAPLAALRSQIEPRSWLTESMLSSVIMTKTSIVRKEGLNLFGKGNESPFKLYQLFCAAQNVPYKNTRKNLFKYDHKKSRVVYTDAFKELYSDKDELFDYAMTQRAACRGAFTGTSGIYAFRCVEGVTSVDATSMHPSQTCSHRVGIDYRSVFEFDELLVMNLLAEIATMDKEEVCENYRNPFPCEFMLQVAFTNVRLREGSAFEALELGSMAVSKYDPCSFQRSFASRTVMVEGKDEDITAEDLPEQRLARIDRLQEFGYGDYGENVKHIFSKMISEDMGYHWLTAATFWEFCQVYSFDEFSVIRGFFTTHFSDCPDYVTLQYNAQYGLKNYWKNILAEYDKGEVSEKWLDTPYIENSVKDMIRNHTADKSYLHSRYMLVKADLNGIYGTTLTDEYNMKYTYNEETGRFECGDYISPETIEPIENSRVAYNVGMSTVAWSRVAQVINIQSLYEHGLGVVDLDTDSLHVVDLATEKREVTYSDIMNACKIYNDGITKAIQQTEFRMKRKYPSKWLPMPKLGIYVQEADVTNAKMIAFWNKTRVWQCDGELHVIMAGITTQRKDLPDFKSVIEKQVERYGFEVGVKSCVGFNVTVPSSLTGQLAKHEPRLGDTYEGKPCGMVLNPMDKIIGDTSNMTNKANAEYLIERGIIDIQSTMPMEVSPDWLSDDTIEMQ